MYQRANETSVAVAMVDPYDAFAIDAFRLLTGREVAVRVAARDDFEAAFEQCDVLLAPTCPTTAFKLGEKTADPLTMYLSDIYVVATNPAGVPALSLPCGFANGMPVGMQLIGKHLSEDLLLRVGHAYQAVTDWHKRIPEALQ